MTVETSSTPKSRGKRLSYVRSMAQLTKSQLSELAKVGISSISYWEDGKGGGLTRKAADKLCEAFNKHGISCSRSWLLDEIGSAPSRKQYAVKEIHEDYVPVNLSKDLSLKHEIQNFKAFNDNAIVLQINDDVLAPLYNSGDYVGAASFELTQGYLREGFYIVQLADESYLACRYITKEDEQFRTHTVEFIEKVMHLIPSNETITQLSRVIWHRVL